MNARARIERLERAARRRRIKADDTKLHFILGGSPEEKAAIEAGEKILRFDYGSQGAA
jgi:hypothetical protein